MRDKDALAAGDCRDPDSSKIISGALDKAASSRRIPRRKRPTGAVIIRLARQRGLGAAPRRYSTRFLIA
ncbi:MAG: hypothetical protein IKS45_06415 [Thermoguttaceae bacterium]|nr:hypothetical protein [Thermoguttaceae bacterium]MBR6436122.1 hypothetical protein [Thermoguttaceae bacterium]